ncbi:MAG: hypothetical protein IJQ66_03700 [Clostridia bacterium]|nr:hypothetical protein [Clostridia bacterium]
MSGTENGKKLFKWVSVAIIFSVAAAGLVGIGLLFNIIGYSNVVGNILLTLLTTFIAGLFLLNSINAVKVGNKLGIFAAFMLILSAALYYVKIWFGITNIAANTVFTYFIVLVSMASILLDLIVADYVELGKSFLAVQIAFYVAVAYIELTVSLLIFGNKTLINLWQIFVTAIIVAFVLYIVLKVKKKNLMNVEKADGNGEYVTITRAEYENLKALAERNGRGDFGEQVILPAATVGVNGSADGMAGGAVVQDDLADKND